jgi:hypothetical protein
MFSFLFTAITIVLNIIAIAAVLKSRHDNFTKAVLIILILMFPIIGSGVYLLVFRDK